MVKLGGKIKTGFSWHFFMPQLVLPKPNLDHFGFLNFFGIFQCRQQWLFIFAKFSKSIIFSQFLSRQFSQYFTSNDNKLTFSNIFIYIF